MGIPNQKMNPSLSLKISREYASIIGDMLVKEGSPFIIDVSLLGTGEREANRRLFKSERKDSERRFDYGSYSLIEWKRFANSPVAYKTIAMIRYYDHPVATQLIHVSESFSIVAGKKELEAAIEPFNDVQLIIGVGRSPHNIESLFSSRIGDIPRDRFSIAVNKDSKSRNEVRIDLGKFLWPTKDVLTLKGEDAFLKEILKITERR